MAALQGRFSGCTAGKTRQAVQLSRSSAGALTKGSPAARHDLSYHQRRIVCAKENGGNVIDRPTTLPGLKKGKDVQHRKPPMYRVLLHNDTYNRREYVVRVLLKVVEGYTVDEAVNVMQEAHINGLALVTMCAQEVAERYVESLRLNGLISTLEPAGPNK